MDTGGTEETMIGVNMIAATVRPFVCAFAVIVLLAFAVEPARAQGGYVGAAIAADVVRFSHTESSGQADNTGGEALSFALRAGASIGSRWGVELEFARPSEIDNISSPVQIFTPAAYAASSAIAAGGTSAIASILPSIFPPISFEARERQRNTTLATMAWARQEITRRFALVYLGGVGFYRRSLEYDYSYGGPLPLGLSGIFPYSSRSITYGAGPSAGIEARVGLTDHVRIVPGVRIQGLEGGWLVRPAVALAWQVGRG
jgi:hypothetical protein